MRRQEHFFQEPLCSGFVSTRFILPKKNLTTPRREVIAKECRW